MGSRYEGALHVLRLRDGARLGSTAAPCRDAVYVAADPASGLVFASTRERVVALRWDAAARALVSADLPQPRPSPEMGGSDVLPHRVSYRPLAVVPGVADHHRAAASSAPILVVGSYLKGDLTLVELPSCKVLGQHSLEGVQVAGLAADPRGTALAVCDAASQATLVLPWPLE